MSQAEKRVLIVDDHPMMRAGIRATLERYPGFRVVGEASTPAEFTAALAQALPDVVLLDLCLQHYDGITLIKEVLARWPKLPILVHSMRDEETFAERVLKAGASGYLMKDVHPEEVVRALETVIEGNIALSRKMYTRLCSQALASNSVTGDPSDDPVRERLSDRELHVFQLLGAGLSTREIAAKLSLSPKTIEAHRENIKQKLDLPTAEKLLAAAEKWLEGK